MAKKSRVNINRKEAYKFYRSIGYSVEKASNARNRSSTRLIKEYKRKRILANKRYVTKKLINRITIHRPMVIGLSKEIKTFQQKIKKYGVSRKISNWMSKDSKINQDLYLRRMLGLKKHFRANDISWNDLLKEMEVLSSLGDWLDFLGEKYSETT